jgi:Protein of unknown function (DUF3619)
MNNSSSRTPLTPLQRETLERSLETKFGKAAKHYLDASASQVKPDVARRLAEARRMALVQMNTRPAHHSVSMNGTLAQAGGWSDRVTDPTFWGAGLLVALALALYGGMQWDQNKRAQDAAEADIEILGSDVPMDAYFDKGFKTWVKQGQ